MKYESKVLFNPTDQAIEFMCDRTIYEFSPGEKRNLEGFVAHHALKEVNTGLVEYVAGENEVITSNVAYDKMPWKKLVSMASERGVFKPGDSKLKVITALIESDEQETGIVSEPTAEEA